MDNSPTRRFADEAVRRHGVSPPAVRRRGDSPTRRFADRRFAARRIRQHGGSPTAVSSLGVSPTGGSPHGGLPFPRLRIITASGLTYCAAPAVFYYYYYYY